MLATYHNHSAWSDGKATLAEIVASAAEQGISELGISDHLALHPSGVTPGWSMKPGRVGDYLRELREIAAPGNLAIRRGLEVDWFDGHATEIAAFLKPLDVDYIIGSVHYVGSFTIDGSPEPWRKLADDEREAIHHDYWVQVAKMASSGLYDIAAHLDLPKKFGFFARRDLRDVIGEALDALAAADMVIELNTAGWHKPCADGYPTLEILREAFRRDIPVTLSADAHLPAHLLRDFDRGAARLAEAGYREVARFRGRERWFEPLEQALSAV